MSKRSAAAVVCAFCKQAKSPHDGMIAELIQPTLVDLMKKRAPEWDGTGFVCFEDLGEFRKQYVKESLQAELGELAPARDPLRSHHG